MSGMNFWSRVENLRKKKGYSRKELASIANINLSNFSKGIKDGSLPSAKTAVKLAQYLNTTVENLVTGHNISKKETNLPYLCNFTCENYLETFSLNLKFYRIAKGWTKTELAIQADIPENQIGRIETGKQKPSFDKIIALSNALKITPASLFLRNVSNPIFTDFEQLSDQQYKDITQLIKTLVENNKKNAMEITNHGK